MTLRENLTPLLPLDAVNWLCSLYDAIQFFDDVHDKKELTQEETYRIIKKVLVDLPNSQFWYAHGPQIAPLISVQYMKWTAANKAESEGRADAKSFVWRAGYFDIVLFVVGIYHGEKIVGTISELLLRLYGEELDGYLREMSCQT